MTVVSVTGDQDPAAADTVTAARGRTSWQTGEMDRTSERNAATSLFVLTYSSRAGMYVDASYLDECRCNVEVCRGDV